MGDLIDRKEAIKAMAELVSNMDVIIASVLAKSKLCRAYYLGLIKEGFKEREALELCKYFTSQM